MTSDAINLQLSAAINPQLAEKLLDLLVEAVEQGASQEDVMELLLGAACAIGRRAGLSDTDIQTILELGLRSLPGVIVTKPTASA